MAIPKYLVDWFIQKGWKIHSYQTKMLALFSRQTSTLLIAPTGGGKTLASFLPSLIDIHENKFVGLHTLYISPLKALTTDIQRNLVEPIEQMNLKVVVDTRTGDTTTYKRKKQRLKPPNILLTTPESLMLLLSYTDADKFFGNLKSIIIDELHSFVSTKRGDLTALGLAKLNVYSPNALRFGLSATVAEPEILAAWLGKKGVAANIITAQSNLKANVKILTGSTPIPYSGFMAKYAINEIYAKIKKNNMTIVFVNTRAQAEFIFRELWYINKENFPIAIYHGSIAKEQRIKTEKLSVEGNLKAVVATSALELGIDWSNIDEVIQIGAPKGVSRLLQRIGRSNHQFDKASQAWLVPSNCFEALECQSAIDAIGKNKLDGDPFLAGSLDVVVQFIINSACSSPIHKAKLFKEIRLAYPYCNLKRDLYEKLFQFAVDGGYTLQHYEHYHRLIAINRNIYKIASSLVIRRHRQNIGTIVESAKLWVKILNKRSGRKAGSIEEAFAQQLVPGDTFLFAGEILEFVAIRDMVLEARKTKAKDPKLPSYQGGTMPLSTYLAEDVRELINTKKRWANLPNRVSHWLNLQENFSILPNNKSLLIEHFPHKKLFYTIVYSFEGRRANHTLGILITQRMEKLNLKPLSFTVTDYGLAISSLKRISIEDITKLASQELIFDELEEWLNLSPLLKRTFRQVAIISGLTERQLGGTRKSLRQVTFSTDLIYDVLMRHEPNHVLLTITRHDVDKMLLDLDRLKIFLNRFKNKIIIKVLERPSPFAIPMLSAIKTEKVKGSAIEELLSFAQIEAEANDLMNEVQNFVR